MGHKLLELGRPSLSSCTPVGWLEHYHVHVLFLHVVVFFFIFIVKSVINVGFENKKRNGIR